MSIRIAEEADDLEKLGRGATIVDRIGDVWTSDGDSEDPWGSVTASAYTPTWSNSSEIPLPATIVYAPGD